MPRHLPCPYPAQQSSDQHQATIVAASWLRPTAHASTRRIPRASSGWPAWPSGGSARRSHSVPSSRSRTRTNVTGSGHANARTLNSICVEPILVLEQRAKQRRNLPMMISLGARWKRAGRAQQQFRLAVGRSMYWQHASNRRRHGKPPIRLSFTG